MQETTCLYKRARVLDCLLLGFTKQHPTVRSPSEQHLETFPYWIMFCHWLPTHKIDRSVGGRISYSGSKQSESLTTNLSWSSIVRYKVEQESEIFVHLSISSSQRPLGFKQGLSVYMTTWWQVHVLHDTIDRQQTPSACQSRSSTEPCDKTFSSAR